MRKKLVAFIALLLLVTGSSVNAEEQAHPLKDWYEKQFRPMSEELGAKTAEGLVHTFRTSKLLVHQSKTALSLAMLEFSDAETKEVVWGIQEVRRKMQDELISTTEELKKEDFEGYKAQLSIEQTVAEDIDALLADVLNQE